MKALFDQYKPFLLFLGKFFLAYLVLTILYQSYLESLVQKVDLFTDNVSCLTRFVARTFGMDYDVTVDSANEQIKVLYNGNYQMRIIEGCNAISVIILFISFVLAFSSKFKSTLLYCCGGGALIYILNIFRIVFLAVLLYKYPKQEHLLHGVLFPFIIYGIVFLLWLVWIKKYSKYAAK